MTGRIVGLIGSARTGTIRSQDGTLLTFSAEGVLGEFDTLAVGHQVSFDPDRSWLPRTAVRVIREPRATTRPSSEPDARLDLRYAGFTQAQNVRSYRFDSVASGSAEQQFVVVVDLALMLKHRIGVQEAPTLCLRKLAADLKALPEAEAHELRDEDLRAYASSKAAAAEKKGHKHNFAKRRGAPPGSPNPPRAT